MNATERFVALVAGEESQVRLDVGALCIAAHAHPTLDVDAGCARFDELAAGCTSATFAGVRGHLFGTLGFRGNDEDYADPENSFLDSVIERRVGLPIALAVLVIEVARRLGVEVVGVGMPGHFLVREVGAEGVWCDPFAGGVLLDRDACRRRFDAVFLGARAFDPSFLAGTSSRAILARMLANLEQGRLANDPAQLRWMCELHAAIPGLSVVEHRWVAARLRRLRARWN
jgi:regulator of sirC expression with transglutaminase-like and TPR domain